MLSPALTSVGQPNYVLGVPQPRFRPSLSANAQDAKTHGIAGEPGQLLRT